MTERAHKIILSSRCCTKSERIAILAEMTLFFGAGKSSIVGADGADGVIFIKFKHALGCLFMCNA